MAKVIHQLQQSESELIIFGHQSLSFTESSLRKLYTNVVSQPGLQWIFQALSELPKQLNRLEGFFPGLSSVNPSASPHLTTLVQWFQTGDIPSDLFINSNILLTPLVIINHLVQYHNLLNIKKSSGTNYHNRVCEDARVLGLCTGLLSALAVSSSHDSDHIAANGSVAIRLAVLVGAIVDAQELSDPKGAAVTLAAAWTSEDGQAKLAQVLKSYTDAHVSVKFDYNRATITVAKEDIPQLKDQLRHSGFSAHELGHRGRFHCSRQRSDLQKLIEFCEADPDLNLHSRSPLFISGQKRVRSSADILRAVLVDQAQWLDDVSLAQSLHPRANMIVFGTEKCLPLSRIAKPASEHVIYMEDAPQMAGGTSSNAPVLEPQPRPGYSDNDIAVIGVGCKFANSDSADELWNVLLTGESQHGVITPEKFAMDTVFRPDRTAKQQWYGNFLSNPDCFDHKFFNKSQREAASMDPQQRLMLEAAYHALEHSGYFSRDCRSSNIGCYVGIVSTDYQDNVACHAPNAYSATGTLGSFTAGRVSHHFGWTGPSLAVDTACSSSAVAIHYACRSILAGDCDAALAGGALVCTSPLAFHNLAGAAFLSPTGQCKPFDDNADGYCRGEGVAAIFLKRMSAAVADGDPILGCIAATDVRQNENCTSIVVPNSQSLSNLFDRVITASGLSSSQISVVEAHGTGTTVGDMAEWNSIHTTFDGGKGRSQPLFVGSIKGHIGHTECTSGVAALIKVLMMIQTGIIPPQASHRKMNRNLKVEAQDQMMVPIRSHSWDTNFRAALINNYGASGSNASLIVTQPFLLPPKQNGSPHSKVPFCIRGFDSAAVLRNAQALANWLEKPSQQGLSLSTVAFHLSQRLNFDLEHAVMFSSESNGDVIAQLQSVTEGKVTKTGKVAKPVILCFGGQVSKWVGLDKAVFDQFSVLRGNLDACDAIIVSLGYTSVYPGIFQRTPVEDPVHLQTMLFALQYACAQSWIDCGLQPIAAIGHSFGELVALCICGVVSLSDGLLMVTRRAQIIRDQWSSERGVMVAVEASRDVVLSLLHSASEVARAEGELPATIACYNSATSFTIAGSSRAVDIVLDIAARDSIEIRSKPLNVTHAFHSQLVEPLDKALIAVTAGITFKSPEISLMHSSESEVKGPLQDDFIASHLRNPVFFHNAVQRLADEHPSAIWLEAGSTSTIIQMVNRTVQVSSNDRRLLPVDLTSRKSFSNIADVVLALWKHNNRVRYWGHHSSQVHEHPVLFLPPYQFAKTSHWLELRDPPTSDTAHVSSGDDTIESRLWTFVGFQDATQRHARFHINTHIEPYKKYLEGHVIVQEAPICPATLELHIAIEALYSIRANLDNRNTVPAVHKVKNLAPLCQDPSRKIWLELRVSGQTNNMWEFKIYSEGKEITDHVTGQILLQPNDEEQLALTFARLGRIAGHRRCRQLLDDLEPDDLIYGQNIYRAFADVVDYSHMYRGLRKVVGKGLESAARVEMTCDTGSWLDPILTDCFSQTGGIYVNCMSENPPSNIYLATGIEQWVRSPKFSPSGTQCKIWDVLALHEKVSEKMYCTDIFAFDASTGELMEIILGISYTQVSRTTMKNILGRKTVLEKKTSPPSTRQDEAVPRLAGIERSGEAHPTVDPIANSIDMLLQAPTPKLVDQVRDVISDLTGLSTDEIGPDAELGDLGVDSLVAIELIRELEHTFDCEIPLRKAVEITTLPELVEFVSDLAGEEPLPTKDNVGDNSSTEVTTLTSSTPATPQSLTVSSASDDSGKRLGQAGDLKISSQMWLDALDETTGKIDESIGDCGFAGYFQSVEPLQTRMCHSLICEAFAQLDCDLAHIPSGQHVPRIDHMKEHTNLVDYLYHSLATGANLLVRHRDSYFRTDTAVPPDTSDVYLQKVIAAHSASADASNLAYWCGNCLADVLRGRKSGVEVIFGTERARELVSKLYGEYPLNRMYYQHMGNFLKCLVAQLPSDGAPLRIMEMGAGTAGATAALLPILAEMQFPVEYIFSDLSSAFVTAARKRFSSYKFVRFRTYDIEQTPTEDLIESQHLVIACNAVHATRDLCKSSRNIRKVLRPGGALLMLEMTSQLPFVDMIFGLVEGWWLFNDGRQHAIADEHYWESVLKVAGYSHVKWSSGQLPEHKIERLFLALSNDDRYDRNPSPSEDTSDLTARRAAVESYVRIYTETWPPPALPTPPRKAASTSTGHTILITGTTGSLGSHIAAWCAQNSSVKSIICLNRRSRADPQTRQYSAFDRHGFTLQPHELSKLHILATDTSQPHLGLEQQEYTHLISKVTHICHTAWPMSATRSLATFEPQFRILRNLLDLASHAAAASAKENSGTSIPPLGRPPAITFAFISSIAVVGNWQPPSPSTSTTSPSFVPEIPSTLPSVLPNGYGDAKFVCERILSQLLDPSDSSSSSPLSLPSSSTTAVAAAASPSIKGLIIRPAQISGSTLNGSWNPSEHFCSLVKSSQTLGVLPELKGIMSWTSVGDVAGAVGEIIFSREDKDEEEEEERLGFYHVDNPVRQRWEDVIPVLAEAMGLGEEKKGGEVGKTTVGFEEWIALVKGYEGGKGENPAKGIVGFLEGWFWRMSCGGEVLLGTERSVARSKRLAGVGPVAEETIRKYVEWWRGVGFL